MMSTDTTRDRRAALLGPGLSQNVGMKTIDIESLERRNDESIAALEERTSLLRNVTSGIHGELQNHHAILDKMSQGMSGASLGLGATVGKFRRIMENPQSRKSMYIALVAAVALFVLYLWWTR